MKVLITEKLSPNKYIDNSGYLICKDAILARTGSQQYRKNELFLDSDDNSIIEVDRSEEEVFSPETLASFENKPVTVEHPGEDVNPENYKDYSVGFVRDVHRGKTEAGEDVILGTLVITDQDTIENIEKGIRTELSCGYDCDISDDNNGNYAQCHIRGNHVALCEEGRAGIAKIVDSKIKDDYTSFLGNYGFDYLKGSGDYEYWYLKYNDEDFNRLVNRMRQEYPSMIISASPANKTIYIQKSKYGVKDSKVKDVDITNEVNNLIKKNKQKGYDFDDNCNEVDNLLIEKYNQRLQWKEIEEIVERAYKKLGYSIDDSKVNDSYIEMDAYDLRDIFGRNYDEGLKSKYNLNINENDFTYTGTVKVRGNRKDLERFVKEHFDNDSYHSSNYSLNSIKDSKVKDEYFESRYINKNKLRVSIEFLEAICDKYNIDVYYDSSDSYRLYGSNRNLDNLFNNYRLTDSKVKDSYYVVACSEGDLWYNEQGKPDKFENAKRFSTYEEADRFRNSGKGGSVNKINDSELKDGDWLEQAKRFGKEPHFSWGFKNEIEAKSIANKASNYNVIASKVNPLMYLFTGERENLIKFIKDNFSQPHYAIASIKDSKLTDGNWEETEWFEFTADNCKYSFVKGGYGMKFASKADYDRSKNYAKKVHYTGGQWDDKDLTYWDFRSTVISNDSKANDSYTMYKGYGIEYDFYGNGEYTVQYDGDDIWFKTEAEAKKFIDEITSGKGKDSKIKDLSFQSALNQYFNGSKPSSSSSSKYSGNIYKYNDNCYFEILEENNGYFRMQEYRNGDKYNIINRRSSDFLHDVNRGVYKLVKKVGDSKQPIVDALSKIYHKAKDSTAYVVEVLYPDGTLYKKFKIDHDGVYDSEIILKNFFRAYPEYKNDPWLVQISK